MSMSKAHITFWGVRGSLASAGPQTARYGGNTPCVEISWQDTTIICDAGSGIRALGADLIHKSKGKEIRATILPSHIHFDHVTGLPFFRPIYFKKNKFTMMCPGWEAKKLKSALQKLIAPPYFPVNILKTTAKLNFKTFPRKSFNIGPIKIESFKCHHPGDSYAFKFHFPHGKILVHTSDNEPSSSQRKKFINWLKGVDILIHDSQYSPKQYKKKKGWGHSPYPYPIDLAGQAKIKNLVFFHYDPSTTDKELDSIQIQARKYIRRKKYGIRLVMSREGMKIRL